ncbi:MAG TPA: TetR/AcrR family transcriptional regulator [Polyangiaceae bacterium]|jgi:AcrR family transcriptional regulator|nr:TetR/AcrR family transcriptional regulator [Polyangiaceae bacterium]
MTTSESSRETRRTEGRRVHGRSARIVSRVLTTTAEELGRIGYAALRVEDVAALSGVNKTTIYRRWPTKVDLIVAAIEEFSRPPEVPESTSLREDLLWLLRGLVARSTSPIGRGVIRMIQLERAHPDVDLVVQRMGTEHLRVRREVVERAISRGELPGGTNVDLIVDLIFSPVAKRILFAGQTTPPELMEAAVDVVLAGATSGAAVWPPKSRVELVRDPATPARAGHRRLGR